MTTEYPIKVFPEGKQNWSVKIPGAVISGYPNWTAARDRAIEIALGHGPSATITLHKINGKIQRITPRRKAASSPVQAAVETGPATYIARIQKSIDDDPKKETAVNSLAAAIKALPRKAKELDWTAVETLGYDRHWLDDGRVVSIERTSN